MTTTDRTRDVLRSDLGPGEIVHAATQAQRDGGTMRLATRIGTSAAGGAIAAAISANGHRDELAQLLANGLVLAVTNRRVVLLDVTAVSARPKSMVASIDRTQIVDVATGDKRVMLVKLPTIALTLADDGDGDGAPGEPLRFEIPKNARRDAEAVVDALRT